MKYPYFLIVCLVALSNLAVAQIDTIYTSNEKIGCTVKEVTPDAVQFVYPGETVVNSLYKNTIQKIAFRSGRVQQFSESLTLAPITDISEYDKVKITQVESELRGLYKVGDVSSSARGGSVYSNVDRVKERALNKLKMEAVMRGGNLIYMGYQKTDGNQYGSYLQAARSAETIYTGTAYSNNLPAKNEFVNRLAGADLLTSSIQVVLLKGMAITKSEYSVESNSVLVSIRRAYEEGGQLFVDGMIQGFDSNVFRVIRYDVDGFTLLAENKRKLVNYIVRFRK